MSAGVPQERVVGAASNYSSAKLWQLPFMETNRAQVVIDTTLSGEE